MLAVLFYNAKGSAYLPIVLLILAAGIFDSQSALAANEPKSSDSQSQAHELGRKIYNFRCYYCHGYSGDARTLTSRFLTPPPGDFTRMQAHIPGREKMLASVRHGHPGTAMAGFENILNTQEIALVVDFVRNEFIIHKNENTRYHTAENGWPDHERYRIAFAFATGEIALDEKPEMLSAEQIKGRQLFFDACITCHDRSNVHDEGPIWEATAVSFPRNNTSFSYPQVDDISEASVYARHEVAPVLSSPNEMEKRGEQLFSGQLRLLPRRRWYRQKLDRQFS